MTNEEIVKLGAVECKKALEEKKFSAVENVKAFQERIEKTFYDYAARQLQAMILERRGEWDREICQKNHIPLPRITLKYMTSRWGSCTPASRHISISKRLIHYPVRCLDYVLLHEYAHLLVPNHSKAFYQVISEYMPDYKESVRMLR